jgi:Holliday junction resolvase RusA-like endonuclease
VAVEVIVRRPASTKKRRPKGDRDNFEKGVFDAITQAGGWWKDDDQIVEGPFLKRWAKDDEPEGYLVTVRFREDI